MNWIALVAVLCAWLVVGLGVAYLLGRFIHGVEALQNPADLIPAVVSYLRPKKRAKTSLRARATTRIRAQREASNGR